jgi:ATP-dependent RNA helicase RhlE
VATKKEENQDQLREIDRQKRIADPTFKGAFHEKKFSLGRAKKKEKRNLPKDKAKQKQFRGRK